MEPEPKEREGIGPEEERRRESLDDLMKRYKPASRQEARGILYAIGDYCDILPFIDDVVDFFIKVGDEVEIGEGDPELRRLARTLLTRKIVPILLDDYKKKNGALDIMRRVLIFLTRDPAHTRCSGRDLGFLQSFFSNCLDLHEQHQLERIDSNTLAKAFIAIGFMEPVMESPSLRCAAVPLLYRHFRNRFTFVEAEESEWLSGERNLTLFDFNEERVRMQRDIIRINCVCGLFFADIDPMDTRETTEEMIRDQERADALLKIAANHAARMFCAGSRLSIS